MLAGSSLVGDEAGDRSPPVGYEHLLPLANLIDVSTELSFELNDRSLHRTNIATSGDARQ